MSCTNLCTSGHENGLSASKIKKYCERPSPPHSAADCAVGLQLGSKGSLWEVVADKNGKHRWKAIARPNKPGRKKSKKSSKKPAKKPAKKPKKKSTKSKSKHKASKKSSRKRKKKTIAEKRAECKEKGLVYDRETGRCRKSRRGKKSSKSKSKHKASKKRSRKRTKTGKCTSTKEDCVSGRVCRKGKCRAPLKKKSSRKARPARGQPGHYGLLTPDWAKHPNRCGSGKRSGYRCSQPGSKNRTTGAQKCRKWTKSSKCKKSSKFRLCGGGGGNNKPKFRMLTKLEFIKQLQEEGMHARGKSLNQQWSDYVKARYAEETRSRKASKRQKGYWEGGLFGFF